MKFSRIVLSLVVMTGLGLPLSAQKEDAQAGKAVFAKRCAACHGATGEGNEAIAKTLKVEMRHLGSKDVQAHTDAEFHKIIREGNGKMKPVKDVSDQDLANLVAYLRTLAQK